MIDAEVMRLRNLRTAALQARAFARVLDPAMQGRRSVGSRAAQCCWQIARAVTGTLRAHPYLPFQQDVAAERELAMAIGARAEGWVSRRRGRAFSRMDAELRRLARLLADARALTWDQSLSNTFGRLQPRLESLIAEVSLAACREAKAHGRRVPALPTRTSAGPAPSPDRALAENWPYLAL